MSTAQTSPWHPGSHSQLSCLISVYGILLVSHTQQGTPQWKSCIFLPNLPSQSALTR